MFELCQFGAQRSYRAAETLNVLAVADHHFSKAPQPTHWRFCAGGPALQHRLGVGRAQRDHRFKDFVFGLEVVVEVSPGDAHRIGDVTEGRGCIALLVEEPVGGFDDLVAGRFSRPPLTTLAPDPAEAGAALVEAVLDEGEAARRRVPVKLIRRGSTAR